MQTKFKSSLLLSSLLLIVVDATTITPSVQEIQLRLRSTCTCGTNTRLGSFNSVPAANRFSAKHVSIIQSGHGCQKQGRKILSRSGVVNDVVKVVHLRGGGSGSDSGSDDAPPSFDPNSTSINKATLTTVPIPIPLFIPNILCYIRILLAFISIHMVSKSSSAAAVVTAAATTTTTALNSHDETQLVYSSSRSTCLTILLWIGASLLDHIDGKIAKKLNQCSEFGVVLDIVADNILRASTWTCAIIASVERGHRMQETTEANIFMKLLPRITPIAGIFLISVEWTTMLCTQMLGLMKEKQHWKEIGSGSGNENRNEIRSDTGNIEGKSKSSALPPPSPSPPTLTPKFIQAIFANNFCNTLGVLAMYGLFCAGMWTFLFLREYDRMLKPISTSFIKYLLYSGLIVSYFGRIVAMCVEMWLCFDYLRLVIHMDNVGGSNNW